MAANVQRGIEAGTNREISVPTADISSTPSNPSAKPDGVSMKSGAETPARPKVTTEASFGEENALRAELRTLGSSGWAKTRRAEILSQLGASGTSNSFGFGD